METRTIKIYRLSHAYKEWDGTGFKNMLKDNLPVHIFVDDKEQGTLSKDGTLTIHLNSNANALKTAVLGTKYLIPAGSECYEAYYFNQALQIGPVYDPFRDKLIAFILKIFRSQGMKERILDPNNRRKSVKLYIHNDQILLTRQLSQTKGIKQWASGGDEEKITYSQIGLTPLPQERQPSGYWAYIQTKVEDAVTSDEEADMEGSAGEFTLRSKHKLY